MTLLVILLAFGEVSLSTGPITEFTGGIRPKKTRGGALSTGEATDPGTPTPTPAPPTPATPPAPPPAPAAADTTKPPVDSKAAVTACESAKSSMRTVCMAENSDEVKGAMAGGDMMLFMMSSGAFGGPQGACSKSAEMGRKLNVAMTTWKGVCLGAIMRCRSVCADPSWKLKGKDKNTTDIAESDTMKKECSEGSDMLNSGMVNLLTLMQGVAQAEQCEAQMDPTVAMCRSNPFAPGCGANANDCRNPAMASTTICRCQMNSNLPECAMLAGQIRSGQSSLASLAGASGAASEGAPSQGVSGMDGTSSGFGDALGYENFSGAGGEGGGGRAQGGGGKSVQASTSGTASGQRQDGGGGGGGASSLNTSIRQGFWGGGGGGGGFGGGAPGSGGGSGAGAGPVMASVNGQQVDLKKFMPGGELDPRRRPAGVVGPDGITGPATDLFEKINVRFMALGHTLKQ